MLYRIIRCDTLRIEKQMLPSPFVCHIRAFLLKDAKRKTDRGKEEVTERLPQFMALLRRLSPKNTSPARNEVVYEEEVPC